MSAQAEARIQERKKKNNVDSIKGHRLTVGQAVGKCGIYAGFRKWPILLHLQW